MKIFILINDILYLPFAFIIGTYLTGLWKLDPIIAVLTFITTIGWGSCSALLKDLTK